MNFRTTYDRKETAFVRRSLLYREMLAEKEEFSRHKCLFSEQAGGEVGTDRALLDWILHHRDAWRAAWRRREHRD